METCVWATFHFLVKSTVSYRIHFLFFALCIVFPAVCPGLHSVNVHAQLARQTVVVVVEDGSQVKVGRHASAASARDANTRRRDNIVVRLVK